MIALMTGLTENAAKDLSQSRVLSRKMGENLLGDFSFFCPLKNTHWIILLLG